MPPNVRSITESQIPNKEISMAARVTYSQAGAVDALSGMLKGAKKELVEVKKTVTKGPRVSAAEAKVEAFGAAVKVVKAIVPDTATPATPGTADIPSAADIANTNGA